LLIDDFRLKSQPRLICGQNQSWVGDREKADAWKNPNGGWRPDAHIRDFPLSALLPFQLFRTNSVRGDVEDFAETLRCEPWRIKLERH